jgi:hypothetical protein
MDSRPSVDVATGGGPNNDMGRLRSLLLNGNKTTSPSWLNKPDHQLPSLEQTTPRSLTLNSSIDTTYDESPAPAPEGLDNNSSSPSESKFDPVHAMINLFSPSPKNVRTLETSPRFTRPAALEISTSEDSGHTYTGSNVMESPSLDDSFDPFREIRNMLTPHTNNSEKIQADEQEPKEITPAADSLRQMVNFFSPFKNRNATTPDEATRITTPDHSLQDDDSSSTFDCLQQAEDTSKTPDRLLQAFYPLSHEVSPKRARHHEEDSYTTFETVSGKGRQMVTLVELCRDARKGMAQLAASAKEQSAAEWLKMIRDFDFKELALGTRDRAKRTIRMVLDPVKEIDPIRLLNTAKVSARLAAKVAYRNAQAHPLPWAAIGAVTCVILLHVLFFNKSVGTPAHQYWHFTMNVHESLPVEFSSQIVDRVGDALQTQMGEDGKEAVKQVRSMMTCPAESGEEMLLRISEALKNINPKPDFFDVMQEHVTVIRQNPRLLMTLLADAWEAGRQYLGAEAFDATVL